jgi:outer membrane lipoprotein-sorting protein
MTRFTTTLFCLLLSATVLAEDALTGKDILQRIDENQVLEHAITEATMIIHGRAGTRTLSFRSWASGEDKSFTEYLSPAREQGKKMLKVGDKLWTYTPPPNDRIITISGHLLKQSVMGSDLSYEDLMNNDSLASDYDSTLLGHDTINGRDTYQLELTALKSDAAYEKQQLWVDTERWIILQAHFMAKNGKLLKTLEVTDVMPLAGGWYPKAMTFKDMLSNSGGTEYHIDNIDITTDIPESQFSKAALRR